MNKGSKRRSSLLVASLLAAGSKEEGEVKMKGERRRGGIYRSWIVKVMQINKGEGVFL